MTPEPAGSHISLWGESPVWWRGQLWSVDIEGRAILAYSPAHDEEHAWPTGQRVGFVAPRRIGGVVWGGDHGLHFLDPDSGATWAIADPEPDKPRNRFNDGKCSPDGRLFAGTIALDKTPGAAALYRLDPDLFVQPAFGPVTNSNGLAWSPDGSVCYYIDTPSFEVKAFRYDAESGDLHDPRVAFRTPKEWGSPDGMAIDVEGMLWIAFCHGGCVRRIDPRDGRELGKIEVPARETTSVAFGGRDRRDLFITTGRPTSDPEPLAGRLFVVRGMPVAGPPATPFAG